jgi:SAM-dependent methyltransferase
MKLYRGLFKTYFALHDAFESRFFYYACKALGKPHPKNLFDYRTRVFLDHLDPADRVADLGCGTGKLVTQMRGKAAEAIGVDVSVPLLLKDDFLKKNILDADLPDLLLERRVDTITLSHVLEHIENPVELLGRLAAFRKILICVPSEENWKFQFKKSLGLDPRTDPTHYREYSIPMLRAEAEAAGLKVNAAFYNSEGEIFAACEGRAC